MLLEEKKRDRRSMHGLTTWWMDPNLCFITGHTPNGTVVICGWKKNAIENTCRNSVWASLSHECISRRKYLSLSLSLTLFDGDFMAHFPFIWRSSKFFRILSPFFLDADAKISEERGKIPLVFFFRPSISSPRARLKEMREKEYTHIIRTCRVSIFSGMPYVHTAHQTTTKTAGKKRFLSSSSFLKRA